jgi:hypothetical protein
MRPIKATLRRIVARSLAHLTALNLAV